jgi:hypothetical protein
MHQERPQLREKVTEVDFWGCTTWLGNTAFLQGIFLASVATSAFLGGVVVVTIPWRPRSSLSKLPMRQALWIGLRMIIASLGMLSLVVPPIVGYNRCP